MTLARRGSTSRSVCVTFRVIERCVQYYADASWLGRGEHVTGAHDRNHERLKPRDDTLKPLEGTLLGIAQPVTDETLSASDRPGKCYPEAFGVTTLPHPKTCPGTTSQAGVR